MSRHPAFFPMASSTSWKKTNHRQSQQKAMSDPTAKARRSFADRKTSSRPPAIDHAVNLLSFLFARIYFPTFSNGLKEIAGYLGFRWSGSPVSGLEAIVWRRRWEAS